MEQLTNVKLFTFIQECIANSLDDRAAFNKLRSTYLMNGLEGSNSNDRQKNFCEALAGFRTRPAALALRIRMSRVEAFREALRDAFDSQAVDEVDVEDWYDALRKGMAGTYGVTEALELLAMKNPEASASLRAQAEALWPSMKPEPKDAP